MGFFDKIKKALMGADSKPEEENQAAPQIETTTSETALPSSEAAGDLKEETKDQPAPAPTEPVEPVAPDEQVATTDQPAITEQPAEQEATPALQEETLRTPETTPETTLTPEAKSAPLEELVPEPEEEADELPLQPAETVAEKYDQGLKKSRKTFGQRLNELFANFRSVDEDFFEEVEETMIGADVGFDAAMKIADQLRQEVKLKNAKKPADVQNVIVEKLVNLYDEAGADEVNTLNIQPNGLTVMLFVGVNGVGKTTSIGKLAYEYRVAGKKVLMAAADTFRAGAIDQLVVWGQRAGVEVVRGKAGGDPAAVVFDAMAKAKAENYDILLVDTAGRLQNKVNLMNELEKIKRVIQREEPAAPHEVLLVLDATTGQNAMVQAKQFKETTDVTGLVLTKLDGTAKGGIVLAIRNELRLPVKLVGLGEGIDDLEPFDPNAFIVGMFKGLIK